MISLVSMDSLDSLNFLNSFFWQFAETSLRASVVIALFLLFRPWLRRFVGSQWLGVLWVFLLARLLLPLPVQSPWSLAFEWPNKTTVPAATALPTGIAAKAKITLLEDGKSNRRENPKRMTPPQKVNPVNTARFFGMIWISGAMLALLGLAIRAFQTRQLASRTVPATDARLLMAFHAIVPELRRNISLRMTAAVDVPTLANCFRPQIWIPLGWLGRLTADEMRHVLLHELGHARRRDLWVQWLFALVQSVHWFNPLVWLAARCARLDREMACDAWVLARSDANELESYGMTLMKTARWLHGPLRTMPGAVAMASAKESLVARVEAIGSFHPVSQWRGVLGMAGVVIGLAMMTSSRANEKETKAESSIEAPGVPSIEAAGLSEEQIEFETKLVYLPESAFERVRKQLAGTEFSTLGFAQAPQRVTAYLPPGEGPEVMKALAGEREASLLSTPKARTPLKQQARIDITRDFRYVTEYVKANHWPYGLVPTAFTTKKVGVYPGTHAEA